MNRIKELRESLEKTQDDLAKDLNVSRQTVSRWEYDQCLNSDDLWKLADYFKCSIDYLVGRTSIPNYDNKAIKKYLNEMANKISTIASEIKD